MNREARRRGAQPIHLNPSAALQERNITTNVGILVEQRKVMLGFSFAVKEVFMPPENAVQTAIHLLMSARKLDPDFKWPTEAEAVAHNPGTGNG